MKKSMAISVLLFFFILPPAQAQLAHTTWQGTMLLETNTNVFWRFDKDTTQVNVVADSSLVERMTYKTEPGILYLVKVSGISSCDNQIVGKYKYVIKEDKLYLSLISDSCSDRSGAISSDPYIKIK